LSWRGENKKKVGWYWGKGCMCINDRFKPTFPLILTWPLISTIDFTPPPLLLATWRLFIRRQFSKWLLRSSKSTIFCQSTCISVIISIFERLCRKYFALHKNYDLHFFGYRKGKSMVWFFYKNYKKEYDLCFDSRWDIRLTFAVSKFLAHEVCKRDALFRSLLRMALKLTKLPTFFPIVRTFWQVSRQYNVLHLSHLVLVPRHCWPYATPITYQRSAPFCYIATPIKFCDHFIPSNNHHSTQAMYSCPQVSVMTGSPHGQYTSTLTDTYDFITWYWHISRTTVVFIGAFAKLRKETIICVLSVYINFSLYLSARPSVCMQQLAYHRKDFHEIWY